MIWLIGLLMSIYVLGLLRAMMVWGKKNRLPVDLEQGLKVSVIVPFRNEAEHLPLLIESLRHQNYPELEVIFINDHSIDDSLIVLERALNEFPFPYQVIQLKAQSGKKAAISHGIAAASGEIILTTDADCEFEPEWVSEMAAPFADELVQMVAGPVALTGKSLFQRWQKMEFATLIALGAVSIRKGTPSMANGANLAYRKSVFEAVNGFEGVDQTPSGDDELLMMKVHQDQPGSIVFNKSRKAIVSTAALKSWSALRHQRLRWASKWKVGKRPGTAALALFIFLLNLMWLLLPVFSWLDWVDPEVAIRTYSIRFVIEAIWVMVVAVFFDQAISIRAFILHQYLYPFYVIYFGLMANFGNYKWKGRSYSVQVQ